MGLNHSITSSARARPRTEWGSDGAAGHQHDELSRGDHRADGAPPVPAVYPLRYFAASGGPMSYGTDVAEVFLRAAAYVNRILSPAICQCKFRLNTSWSSI